MSRAPRDLTQITLFSTFRRQPLASDVPGSRPRGGRRS